MLMLCFFFPCESLCITSYRVVVPVFVVSLPKRHQNIILRPLGRPRSSPSPPDVLHSASDLGALGPHRTAGVAAQRPPLGTACVTVVRCAQVSSCLVFGWIGVDLFGMCPKIWYIQSPFFALGGKDRRY